MIRITPSDVVELEHGAFYFSCASARFVAAAADLDEHLSIIGESLNVRGIGLHDEEIDSLSVHPSGQILAMVLGGRITVLRRDGASCLHKSTPPTKGSILWSTILRAM